MNHHGRIVMRKADHKVFEIQEESEGLIQIKSADREGHKVILAMTESELSEQYVTQFGVVAVDESAHWTDSDFVQRCGGKIWTLYVYNPNEVTYLCEATPSYYLEPFDHVPASLPEGQDECEEICNVLLETLGQQEMTYMHCRHVDAMPTRLIEDFDALCTLDDAREHWQGNAPNVPGI